MKLYEYEDEAGYKRILLIRDGDPLEWGIPIDLPDLPGEGALRRDLNNELVSRRLFSWADVQRQEGVLTGVARKVGREHNLDDKQVRDVRRHLIAVYKQRR